MTFTDLIETSNLTDELNRLKRYVDNWEENERAVINGNEQVILNNLSNTAFKHLEELSEIFLQINDTRTKL